MTIDLSLGEFESAVAKALRGVDYPWGLAADGARDARHLAALGLDPLPALLALCDWADATPSADRVPGAEPARSGSACPICIGSTISDLGVELPASLGEVIEPVLLVPALQRAARRSGHAGISLFTPSCTAVVSAHGVVGTERLTSAPVTLAAAEVGPAPSPVHTRIAVTPEHWARVGDYAHRTYAPATEASRQSGAGAGLTDND